MPQPEKIPSAFASAGDVQKIPEVKAERGRASWNDGFPPETQIPIAAGGLAPQRKDFNGIFNALSEIALWAQQGGKYIHDKNVNYDPGNVILDGGGLYFCVKGNGPDSDVKVPSEDAAGEYWKLIFDKDGALNVPKVQSGTTEIEGTVRFATREETKALAAANRAVSPDALNGLLSLTNAAGMVPKADTNGKITNWLNGLKNNAGYVDVSVSGSAAKLQTARKINGVPFDGTKDITILESSVTNKNQNGYVKLQSGIMIQWGKTQKTGRSATIKYPQPFTTVFSVVAQASRTGNATTGGDSYNFTIMGNVNNKSFSINTLIEHGIAELVFWIAIGV